MIDFLLSLVLVGLLVGIVAVGWAARNTRVSSAVALGVAAFCGVALLAMLITDWPTGVLAEFWAEHSVLAAVLTTVLTVGFAFMAYEVHDLREQVRLHDNVSAAGLGGVVEPLSAVRRALELAAGDREPDMSGSSRPLKWLVGHELESRGQAAGPTGVAARTSRPGNSSAGCSDARLGAIDQHISPGTHRPRRHGKAAAGSHEGEKPWR